MTAALTKVISAGEAAFILRARLGPLRQWVDFLADNIRGKQDVAGHTLLPCGRQKDGKALRPVYAVSDVAEFIANVLASVPCAGKTPVKTATLAIDRRRHWRLNRFNQDGSPVALRSTGARARRMARGAFARV